MLVGAPKYCLLKDLLLGCKDWMGRVVKRWKKQEGQGRRSTKTNNIWKNPKEDR